MKTTVTSTLLVLLALPAAAGASPLTGRKPAPAPARGGASPATPAGYRFEGQPRPALQAAGLGSTRDPKLGMHAGRLLHVLSVSERDGHTRLSVLSSRDSGDTFEEALPVSPPDAEVASHGENSPSLVCSGGALFVLWEQSRAGGGSDLVCSRAVQMGRPFAAPVRVTDKTAPSGNSFSSLAQAPNGDLYAVWLDGRDRQPGGKGGSSVYVSRSTDRGATWSKNVSVAGGVCPCCRPTLAFGSGGEVFVSWRHVFPGDIRDMVIAASRDSGASWGAPVRVANDGWKIDGCPHTGAAMLTRGSRLYVTWYSEGTGKNPGIRLAWSDDGGRSFSPARIVSGGVLDANHPALAATDEGRLLMVFQGRDPRSQQGWGPLRPYLVEMAPDGSASHPEPLPGKGGTVAYPTLLAASLGRVFVAWSEAGKDGTQVLLARGRRTTAPR